MDSGSVWQQQYSRDPEGRVGELCIVDKGSSRCEDWRHDLGRECREGSLKQVSLSRVRLLLWVCLLYLIENSSWPGAPEEAKLELGLDWCCSGCRPSGGLGVCFDQAGYVGFGL